MKFRSDETYYELNNFQRGYFKDSAILIPGSDLLIVRPNINLYTNRLMVYEDFSSQLVKVDSNQYTWQQPQQPDYLLKADNGEELGVTAVGHSSNGKWLVAEFRGRGIIRVNLETKESERVSDYTRPYGTGLSPSMDMRISNDGKHIAIVGQNSGFRVIDVENCGDSMPVNTSSNNPLQNTCDERDLYSLIYNLDPNRPGGVMSYPRFSDDGGELTIVWKNTNDLGEPDIITTLTASGYLPSPQLDYLALGDSYSSGEGDTERDSYGYKYYRAHTDVGGDSATPREKCHVSTRSYPYLLAQSMNLALDDPREWNTVACSGALTRDVMWNDPDYLGQGDRLGGFGNINVEDKKAEALNEFIPGRVKQIEFVKKYKPKVITLTMGGNDVEFGKKLDSCANFFSPGTCNWARLDWRNKLKSTLKDQYQPLKELYDELKFASNNQAKIYVLGYPQFINGAPSATCQNGFNLNANEREMIVNSITYYNKVIKQAAEAAGVKYIDIEAVFGGHKLCDSGKKYVTAITNIAGLSDNERQESFHPNARGHAAIKQATVQQLGNQSLLEYDPCPSTAEMYCPDESATKAAISDIPYFTIADENEDLKFAHYQLSTGVHTKTELSSSPLNILTKPYMFKLGTDPLVSIFSEPTPLGTVDVEADGSIDYDVDIPPTLPAGYHTLVVSGETYSGEDVELYQTILVKGGDPDDIDENGIPDSQQSCGAFTAASNEDADFDGIDDACDPEVTDPILYYARNGYIANTEDPNKLYVYRNTHAESITGVDDDYVDTSTNSENNEALVASSLDNSTEGILKKFVMLEDENDSSVKIPTLLVEDDSQICSALQPVDYLSPALNPASSDYQPRGLTKLTQLPEGENCE